MLLGLQIRHYPEATPESFLLNLNLLSVTTLSFGDNIYVRRIISTFPILFSFVGNIKYVDIQLSFLPLDNYVLTKLILLLGLYVDI